MLASILLTHPHLLWALAGTRYCDYLSSDLESAISLRSLVNLNLLMQRVIYRVKLCYNWINISKVSD